MPLVLLNKPFHVLSQFTTDGDKDTLANYVSTPGVYAAGRLDYDSEGLLVLTDDGALQARISHPRTKLLKTYCAQVEGAPSEEQLNQLKQGVRLKDGPARVRSVREIPEPPWLWPRTPPIRYRKNVVDRWLEIQLDEGRNRQVRRMTAAVGLPTLRLVRSAIGPWQVDKMDSGKTVTVPNDHAWQELKKNLQPQR
ncbi:MAG: pseudouridine synthase [Gammaproteobacteria bacterium]